MICDNCGHINPNINKTCDKCGKKLEPAPRYPTKTNKSTNRNYEKNEGLFDDIKNLSNEKKIIGVCCLVLALIFAVSSVMPYHDVNEILPIDNNSTDYTTDVNNSPEVVEQAPAKTNTKINVTAKSPVNSGNSTTIKGYLTDESNNPLPHYEVQIKIANNEFDVKTSYDGSYTLEFNDTENGSQNVSVSFEETDDYYGCYNNTFFEVTNNTTHNLTNNNTTANNTTHNTHNDTNNTTDNQENKTNDNHDTHNSILSSLFNNHNDNKDNLTNSTNNTTEDNNKTNNRTNNTANTYNHSPNNTHNNTTQSENHTNTSITHTNNTTHNNTNNTTNTNNSTDENETYHNNTKNSTEVENNTTEDKHSKSNTKIDLNIENNVQENQKTNISGTLLDDDNLPVTNAIIKIKIDGREYVAHTNSAGEYSIEYTPTTDKNIDIEVIYDGDDNHSSSHKTSTMNIN